ncbi:hypothetical protein M5689_016138 [Euphorbia peplus]|nr:hypothetical protein M5689_016138 [Euphorbia peplus]
MDMKNLISEEKALDYIINNNYKRLEESLEERVSVFLDEEFYFFNNSSSSKLNNFNDWDDNESIDSHNSIQRTLFWESQEALLQEVLERYSLTSSRLRQEINRIIEIAKETNFCSCFKPNSIECISCLRRNVVDFLSQRGFNATLCTSLWKPTNKFPGGKHDYIEVKVSTSAKKKQITYVIELEFKGQFEIAKASDEYTRLIAQLPKYYIGKADFLNAIVGIICDSAKRSMKEKKLHMGPWRKRSFMQMKWSSSSSSSSSSPVIDGPLSSPTSISKFPLVSNNHFQTAPTVIVK